MNSKVEKYVNKQAIIEVLGSFITNPDLMRVYPTNLADFPKTFYKIIFGAIYNLYKKGVKELDVVVIDEFLSHYPVQYKVFTAEGRGMEFIEQAIEICNPSNIDYYHTLLKKFTLLRRYVESGIDVSEYYDPDEFDANLIAEKAKLLNDNSIHDIINHFKKKILEVAVPFSIDEGRQSKKAGEGALEQKEAFKRNGIWGLGYSSAFLTTILRGMRKGKFTIKSASSGVGKTRGSIADICHACSPKYYDKKSGKWLVNPNGKNNRILYIGTEMELLTEIEPILWAYIADVPQDHIVENRYDEGEEERVEEAIRILKEEGSIWLEYIPDFDIDTIESIIEEHKLKNNIDYVFFDYLHTTPKLISEFASKSSTKMAIREDQALFDFSNHLKQMTKKYNISIDTFTQMSGDYKNENNRDESIVRGAKAIIDKADSALIISRPTDKELIKIESILNHQLDKKVIPNVVYSVYKNRDGKYKNVKVWVYIDYSTMRVHDLFVTDYNYKLHTAATEGLCKTYIRKIDGKIETSANKVFENEEDNEDLDS